MYTVTVWYNEGICNFLNYFTVSHFLYVPILETILSAYVTSSIEVYYDWSSCDTDGTILSTSTDTPLVSVSTLSQFPSTYFGLSSACSLSPQLGFVYCFYIFIFNHSKGLMLSPCKTHAFVPLMSILFAFHLLFLHSDLFWYSGVGFCPLLFIYCNL
jgi:hypothetical protein